MADAEDRLHTPAEVEEMVRRFMPMHSQRSEEQHSKDQRSAASKLPHQRTIPAAVFPPEAYPELQEAEDPLTEAGQRIGQEAAGRGGLPLRLTHA